MTWGKREAVTNLVVLGDEQGHHKKIGGLLAGCAPDRTFPDSINYTIVQQDGEELVLAGSASLKRQINDLDIGKFIKAEFMGWGKSPRGKFKVIDVHVWEGEITPVQKAWPRYAELQVPTQAQKKTNGKPPVATAEEPPPPTDEDFADFPNALNDEDDDLPF